MGQLKSLLTVVVLTATAFAFISPRIANGEELTGGGEWQSLSAEAIRGKWSVSLTQTGTSVEGTLTLAGSNVFAGGKVSGTVNASSIVFGILSETGKEASFNGKLDGTSISGEWESAVVGDHGVWYGNLIKR
jgi:hypothetical protein